MKTPKAPKIPLRNLPKPGVYVYYVMSDMGADVIPAPSRWRVTGRGRRRSIRKRARGLVHWWLLGALHEHPVGDIDRIEVEAQWLGWWTGVVLVLPADKADGFSIAEWLDDEGLALTEPLDVVWDRRLRCRSLRVSPAIRVGRS